MSKNHATNPARPSGIYAMGSPRMMHAMAGIQPGSQHDDDSPRAAVQQLTAGLQDFKNRYDARIDELQGGLDELASRGAAAELSGGQAGVDPRVLAAVSDFVRRGEVSDALSPQAGLSGDSDPSGGYSIPSQIYPRIQDQLLDLSPMRRVARAALVSSRDFSYVVGQRGASSGWVSENDIRTATNTPTMNTVQPPHGELYAYAEASQWILDDSLFNLESWLQTNVYEEFAVAEDAAFFVGNGADKPKGFLTHSTSENGDNVRPFQTLQTVGAAAATIAPDDLVNLVHALRTPYRGADQAVWFMNTETAAIVSKLKDNDGNYLWQRSLAAGQPDRLLGYRVLEAPYMPSIGSGLTPIAFGNFYLGYLITDRTNMRVIRDPFTRPGFVKYYIFSRRGGQVTDSNAIKLLKMPA